MCAIVCALAWGRHAMSSVLRQLAWNRGCNGGSDDVAGAPEAALLAAFSADVAVNININRRGRCRKPYPQG